MNGDERMQADGQALPSIQGVHLLYLGIVVALLVVGAVLTLPVGWHVIVNELLLIGLPLAVYIRVAGLPARKTLRIYWPGWRVIGLALLMGGGAWLLDSWVAQVFALVFDYQVPAGPAAVAQTTLEAVLLFVGIGLLAPFVEELLFRGLILRSYRRYRPLMAIGMSALLYLIFHLEVIQAVSLIPLALALGYIAWRTGSVLPAIAAHLGNNLIGATLSLIVFFHPSTITLISIGLAATGAALVGVVVYLIRAITWRPPASERRPGPRSVLDRWWPVAAVVIIFMGVAAFEVIATVDPEVLALGQPLEFQNPPWQEASTWHYEIRDAGGDAVGKAQCSLTPGLNVWDLNCQAQQAAYEVRTPTSFFSEGAVEEHLWAEWDQTSMMLVRAELTATIASGTVVTATVRSADEELELLVAVGGRSAGRLGLPATALVAGGGARSPLMIGEWPWRLSALPFRAAYSRRVSLAWPYRSVEGIEGRAPFDESTTLRVRNAERFSTPAGTFAAWRVVVGDRLTAWYDTNPPHALVGYNDDLLTWVLTEAE
jgi:membrane protease YdiL (CAAX protease family)